MQSLRKGSATLNASFLLYYLFSCLILSPLQVHHIVKYSVYVYIGFIFMYFFPLPFLFLFIYIYFLSYLSSILSLLSIDCAMLDLQISFLFFLSFLYIYKYTYIYIYIHTRQKVGQFKGWGEIVMQCLNNVQVSQCAFIKREAV